MGEEALAIVLAEASSGMASTFITTFWKMTRQRRLAFAVTIDGKNPSVSRQAGQCRLAGEYHHCVEQKKMDRNVLGL